VSSFVLAASVALKWFLEDELDRKYSLEILARLSEQRAVVPVLWFYEIGNGLVMACRRKRITVEQADGFLTRLKALPIDGTEEEPTQILDLPVLARTHGLTTYDAAYLALASRLNLRLATTDSGLRRSAAVAGVPLVTV
jgi:predicted nucleic acid-binding protein